MPSIPVGGISRLSGVVMPFEEREPVTAAMAAERLGCRPATIRSWAFRYAARKHGTHRKQTVYDWRDLATIARQLHRGEPVPATPEERDELRAALCVAA